MYPLPPQLQLQAQAQAQAQYTALHAQSHPQPQPQPQPQIQSQSQSQIQNAHHQNPPQNTNQNATSNSNPTKTRPSASCIPCRNRKVKCDRLTPCSTCLSRTHPEQCAYTTTDSDRTAMKSAETIADLRRKIRALKMQVSEDESGNSGTGEGSGGIDWRELEAMETVFGEMREGEEGVVEGVIGMVREGVGMGELAGFIGDLREFGAGSGTGSGGC